MCFLPNRRASMDQAPGPIIAKASARIASATKIHGSPECDENREMAIHSLTMAASAPANGVKKPSNRAIPHAMQIIARTTPGGVASRKLTTPKLISAAPVSRRSNRSPTPGQPSAKFENSLCTLSCHTRAKGKWAPDTMPVFPDFAFQSTSFATESIVPELGLRTAPFEALTSPAAKRCLVGRVTPTALPSKRTGRLGPGVRVWRSAQGGLGPVVRVWRSYPAARCRAVAYKRKGHGCALRGRERTRFSLRGAPHTVPVLREFLKKAG